MDNPLMEDSMQKSDYEHEFTYENKFSIKLVKYLDVDRFGSNYWREI